MRFAVMSDIHGNLAAAGAVFADIDRLDEELEFTVCLGDSVGHAPHPNEVIQLLRERDVNVIRGNYDDYVLGRRENSGNDWPSRSEEMADHAAIAWTRQQLTAENREYLDKLPRDSRVEIARSGRAMGRLKESESEARQARKGVVSGILLGGAVRSMGERPKTLRPRSVVFVHGSPRNSIENLYPDTSASILKTIVADAKANVIIHGHTHMQYQRAVDGVAFVGVGSVGWPMVPGEATYGVFDCQNFELGVQFREVTYDAEEEARDAERSGLPPQMAEMLRRGTAVQPAV